ncbi:ABC transporter ATP-binding protein [Companilactobacillus allii]|uniref:ABC transporter ATP-binding protein n=1 Tax=Companilactobacillus allii TaxID=1847728 RepID=A0A1P8Q4Z6_9LACO|nr:ABC transporter ATP-binding protein [Companilactobacillus allii]APX72926.1 ABC transporter ATP-binding protein [Companilactobacillus allii]USQ67715.1 ABC transporter ATP-binding protein [Companilactobacillus allii]
MTSIIEVDNLNKNYGNKTILENINFKVDQNQIIALIGENGAGKTTLINILLDLISSDSGTVKILNNTKHIKEHLGVMIQQNISITRITVKEIIKLTQSYYQNPLPYEEIIELADLKKLEHSKMNQLSGGQKRRLSFALSITGNPNLLFLDEPTAGMDSQSRTKFWQIIANLKNQHKTIFVTSHYLNELETFADRIIILQNKSIAFDGSIAKLRSLEGESLIEFDSDLLPDLFSSIPEITNFKKISNHYQFTTNNTESLMNQLTPYLNAISNLKVQQNSLDSLFSNFNTGDIVYE